MLTTNGIGWHSGTRSATKILTISSALQGWGVTSITANHAEGEVAPTFTVQMRPNLGHLMPPATHLTRSFPGTVTIAVGGVGSWDCTLADNPRRLAGKDTSYQATYIPTPLYVLKYGSYGKRVVWLSCPAWQYDQYLAQIVPEETEVVFRESDPYASDGHTLTSILQKVGSLAGVPIISHFPPFHVPEPSVVLEKRQTFLEFLTNLLPSGFLYTFDWQNGQLITGLAEPANLGLSIPPGVTMIDYDVPGRVQYTTVELTGAPYKINSGISIDTSAFGKKGFTSRGSTRGLQEIEEILPEETQEINGSTYRVLASRITRMGPDGTPFAVLSEQQELTGPIFGATGGQNGSGVTKRIETENTYENNDPIIYQVPRLTGRTIRTSGYVTYLTPGELAVSHGTVYHLLEDLRVISRSEYLTLSVPPTVLASSGTAWHEDYEVKDETLEYITPATVTPDWPEGFERLAKQSVRRTVWFVLGHYYDCLQNGKDILNDLSQILQTHTPPAVTFALPQDRTIEANTRKVKLQSPGAYVFEDTKNTLNFASGRMDTDQVTTPVNSTPPSSPTQYRTEPLQATVGDKGEQVVYVATATIPTANPADFQRWGTKRYWDLTHPHPTMQIGSRAYVLPQGYRIGGGTVTGWTATQQGAEFSAQMTVV
jgi:hypothetical protein